MAGIFSYSCMRSVLHFMYLNSGYKPPSGDRKASRNNYIDRLNLRSVYSSTEGLGIRLGLTGRTGFQDSRHCCLDCTGQGAKAQVGRVGRRAGRRQGRAGQR